MINFDGSVNKRVAKQRARYVTLRILFITLGLIFVFGINNRPAMGQAVESATSTKASLWAGAGGSGYYIQYGGSNELGITGFIDADTGHRLGVEAEGRWLEYHKKDDIHIETYLGGLRYRFNVGRFQPYAKGLVGIGNFNFPYGYAYGRYLVAAGGGGVDYRLNHRWSVRAVDFEYQYWPQFTYGAMSSAGISTGIRYRIF